MNGYKIDFTTNTITMNYKFAAAAKEYGSPEYVIIKGILADFPTMQTIVKAGREVKATRRNKRLTYANMESHMSVYTNAEELRTMFETVKTLSKPLPSPYKYVVDWFEKQFPDYKEVPHFKDSKLCVLPVAPRNPDEYTQAKAA